MGLSSYFAFTPLHDATHRAVSSNSFLNDLWGSISAFLLFPFLTTPAYRFLHMSHHRYVGDDDLEFHITFPSPAAPQNGNDEADDSGGSNVNSDFVFVDGRQEGQAEPVIFLLGNVKYLQNYL